MLGKSDRRFFSARCLPFLSIAASSLFALLAFPVAGRAAEPAGSPWKGTFLLTETYDSTDDVYGGYVESHTSQTLTWTSTGVHVDPAVPYDGEFPWLVDGGGTFAASERVVDHSNGCPDCTTPSPPCDYTSLGSGSGTSEPLDPLWLRFEPKDRAHPELGMIGWYIKSPQVSQAGSFPVNQTTTCPDDGPRSFEQLIGFAAHSVAGGLFHVDYDTSNMAAPTVTREPDGSIRLRGELAWSPIPGVTHVHATYDFTCVRVAECWPTRPPDAGPIGGDPSNVPGPVMQTLTTTVGRGGRYGSIAGPAVGIACGQGQTRCSASVERGTTVALAGLQAPAGLFLAWQGCDSVRGQQCFVTMNGARTVTAHFVYDFVGQAEPPPDGLFDPDRKAEIATIGAYSAKKGATGCALTAALIGGVEAAPIVFVAGAESTLTRWEAMVKKVLATTVGNCASGLSGTMTSALLLLVDPPDPQWRELALAEPMPKTEAPKCSRGLRRCASIREAAALAAGARRRVAERQEALAVAANRFGNADKAGDKPVQALHAISMRVQSGMLADAIHAQNSTGKRLVNAFKRAGIRSVNVGKRQVANARRQRVAGHAIPRSVVDRLLRKHLITTRAEVTAAVKKQARKSKAEDYDVLAALKHPLPTAGMRRDAAKLHITDLVLLVRAFDAQRGTEQAQVARHAALLDQALLCNAGSPATLRTLAAEAKQGKAGDAGAQIAWAAQSLAARGVPGGPACAG